MKKNIFRSGMLLLCVIALSIAGGCDMDCGCTLIWDGGPGIKCGCEDEEGSYPAITDPNAVEPISYDFPLIIYY